MCTVHRTGFFENKEADAKARGEAPPKKQTAAEAFSDFMASVSSDVRQVSVGVPDSMMYKPPAAANGLVSTLSLAWDPPSCLVPCLSLCSEAERVQVVPLWCMPVICMLTLALAHAVHAGQGWCGSSSDACSGWPSITLNTLKL